MARDQPILIENVSGSLDHESENNINGNALFRWQSDVNDPRTFVDFQVSTLDPILQMRSSSYYPKYGFGAFGVFPFLMTKSKFYRESSQDYGLMGLRYCSKDVSLGVTFMPFARKNELPKSAWLVSRMGRLIAGVQYEPQATRDHADSEMQYGLGIQIDSQREASKACTRAGKRPMLKSDIDAEHFDGLPRELRPFDRIL
ncbi:uncharacterized protein LOC133306826 [Gastrolobium bilobum]|uniref:uncharacterized protein LOC133306826 n=1 Tax=Gastrolobium bilobum TaxID=150636 RepID=UPI002AAF929E|nr:uncharacterized protein LOC133306826 [Gastrolobium bilobum]